MGRIGPTLRNLAIVTLGITGAALLCIAALDWAQYHGFVVSLRWR
jgi:hypothetical protein